MLFKPGLTTTAALALATLLASSVQIDTAQAHAKKHNHHRRHHYRLVHPHPVGNNGHDTVMPVSNGGHNS